MPTPDVGSTQSQEMLTTFQRYDQVTLKDAEDELQRVMSDLQDLDAAGRAFEEAREPQFYLQMARYAISNAAKELEAVSKTFKNAHYSGRTELRDQMYKVGTIAGHLAESARALLDTALSSPAPKGATAVVAQATAQVGALNKLLVGAYKRLEQDEIARGIAPQPRPEPARETPARKSRFLLRRRTDSNPTTSGPAETLESKPVGPLEANNRLADVLSEVAESQQRSLAAFRPPSQGSDQSEVRSVAAMPSPRSASVPPVDPSSPSAPSRSTTGSQSIGSPTRPASPSAARK